MLEIAPVPGQLEEQSGIMDDLVVFLVPLMRIPAARIDRHRHDKARLEAGLDPRDRSIVGVRDQSRHRVRPPKGVHAGLGENEIGLSRRAGGRPQQCRGKAGGTDH